jgi:hypothetical protein
MNEQDNLDNDEESLFPDTTFKSVTIKLVEELGLKTVGAEFQQTTRADVAIHVPDDKKAILPDTAFSFFRSYTKSG